MIRLRLSRPAHLGVAVGPRDLTAVRLRDRRRPAGDDVWSCHLAPPEPQGGWADLPRAFAELREWIGSRRASLHLVLLPPLVQVKRIELPRLPEHTIRQVLIRDASRYFTGVRDPQVVGVTRIGRGRRSPAPYLITASPLAIIESLLDAGSSGGWQVQSLGSAYGAWSAGCRSRWPAPTRRGAHLLVTGTGRVELLYHTEGRLSLVRRFPETDGLSAALELISESDQKSLCMVLAPDDQRAAVTEQLVARGILVTAPGPNDAGCSPQTFAALSAGLGPGPELFPEPVLNARRQRESRRSARLLAGAAALLLCTAGIEYWGAHRELSALQSRRAAIRANVTSAMAVREAMNGLDLRLRALASAEARRSRWVRTLVNVAEHLPPDAHLVGFRGDADSLRLEGESRQAAMVFESLQKAPGVVAVRADAPIRQELRDSVSVERFTLAARLVAERDRAAQ